MVCFAEGGREKAVGTLKVRSESFRVTGDGTTGHGLATIKEIFLCCEVS